MQDKLPEKFNYLLQESQKLVLSDTEKQQMRARLVQFMKTSPAIAAANQWSFAAVFTSVRRGGFLQYAALALVIFVAGTGVAAAAQNALPGDVLYPVKTSVNERVLGFMQFSQEAKVEYEMGLVKLRLEEIEKISAGGRNQKAALQAKTLLDKHLNGIKIKVEKIKQRSDIGSAISINSELEATLSAHAKVINQVSVTTGQTTATAENTITNDIAVKTNAIAQERQNDETALSAKPAAAIQAAAEGKLQATEKLYANVVKFIENHKADISAQSYAKAQQELAVADAMIAEGKARIAVQDYNGAFIMFTKASRALHEIKIYVAGEMTLKPTVDVIKIIEQNIEQKIENKLRLEDVLKVESKE